MAYYCETYKSAKIDREQLSAKNYPISSINNQELSEADLLAAVSAYKRSKTKSNSKKVDCFNCGYDWPHVNGPCPAKGTTCNKCKKQGYFESVCRKDASKKGEKPKDISSVHLFNGIQKISSLSEHEKNSLPKLKVNINVDTKFKTLETKIIADTGAQITVAGDIHFRHFGLGED